MAYHRHMDSDRYPRIVAANESAALVEFGDSIDYGINAKVYALQRVIEESDLSCVVVEMIPTFRSLLVEYDFSEIDFSTISNRIQDALSTVETIDEPSDVQDSNVYELPVAYGGDLGPDLATVANHADLSQDEVIEIHSGADYRVFMLGFAPGFPYLGGMDARIACPRLATPRVRVPAGAVGIAESQTGIYPNESPGGWQIIGRSPAVLFDVDADPPAALRPGATVRFKPISYDEFEQSSKRSDTR